MTVCDRCGKPSKLDVTSFTMQGETNHCTEVNGVDLFEACWEVYGADLCEACWKVNGADLCEACWKVYGANLCEACWKVYIQLCRDFMKEAEK